VQLPASFLKSLSGATGFDKEPFEAIHISGNQITSIRINPAKQSKTLNPKSKIEWTEYGYYLNSRPSFTFDPLFHAGCYYVQEASSMFLEQALKQTVDLSKPLKVLDLCAAPGGKSTHIQSLISKDSLLVSNEVIRSRANILKDNIIKWGGQNVVVTNNDPKDFTKLENYFDVVVVDAPCSGSGLFRREPEAITEWSVNNVQLCSQRQQRILADVLPALKDDGILIYSTCSYSKEEDEDIVDWLVKQCSLYNIELSISNDWGIIESAGGYRFWPDKVKGEGFFLACFQKKNGGDSPAVKCKKKPGILTKAEIDIVSNWVMKVDKIFIKHDNTVYAWPAAWLKDFSFLREQLKLVYSGVLVGELMRDKLVPDHALAMSGIQLNKIPPINLDKGTAIRYLQRKDIEPPAGMKGWCLAAFEDFPLGWMNVLPNRVNNYYPKELRILKERTDLET
jgi:16S rRNA C967 or C1407 C5-methylase (RsmB/RsmF family)/NOL1/NOP2/fmu family ribosome biogenesis protein